MFSAVLRTNRAVFSEPAGGIGHCLLARVDADCAEAHPAGFGDEMPETAADIQYPSPRSIVLTQSAKNRTMISEQRVRQQQPAMGSLYVLRRESVRIQNLCFKRPQHISYIHIDIFTPRKLAALYGDISV